MNIYVNETVLVVSSNATKEKILKINQNSKTKTKKKFMQFEYIYVPILIQYKFEQSCKANMLDDQQI